MAPTRWLADEMLGRLARYLRFVGLDVEWVRDLNDDTIVQRARAEERFLLTRDRALARRLPAAFLVESSELEAQWKSLLRRFPDLPSTVRLVRCSLCNGSLSPLDRSPPSGHARSPPPSEWPPQVPLFVCAGCGHVFWEGTHTRSVRARLQQWADEVGD